MTGSASWRLPVSLLGLVTIGAYGLVLYGFGAFVAPIRDDTGWSNAAIAAAFSVANLAGGLLALTTGRLLDRIGAQPVMAGTLSVRTVRTEAEEARADQGDTVGLFEVLAGVTRGSWAREPLKLVVEESGTALQIEREELFDLIEHGPADEETAFYARWERLSCNPSRANELVEITRCGDVRDILPVITVPTLIVHRTDDTVVPVDRGHELRWRERTRTRREPHEVDEADRHPQHLAVCDVGLSGALTAHRREHVVSEDRRQVAPEAHRQRRRETESGEDS